jgi:hypothetical protein
MKPKNITDTITNLIQVARRFESSKSRSSNKATSIRRNIETVGDEFEGLLTQWRDPARQNNLVSCRLVGKLLSQTSEALQLLSMQLAKLAVDDANSLGADLECELPPFTPQDLDFPFLVAAFLSGSEIDPVPVDDHQPLHVVVATFDRYLVDPHATLERLSK